MTGKDNNFFNTMVGKTVSFGLPNETLALSVQDVGYFDGNLYFLGVIPSGATNNSWADGKRGGVSLSSVSDFMIFDDEDDYNRCIAKNDIS